MDDLCCVHVSDIIPTSPGFSLVVLESFAVSTGTLEWWIDHDHCLQFTGRSRGSQTRGWVPGAFEHCWHSEACPGMLELFELARQRILTALAYILKVCWPLWDLLCAAVPLAVGCHDALVPHTDVHCGHRCASAQGESNTEADGCESCVDRFPYRSSFRGVDLIIVLCFQCSAFLAWCLSHGRSSCSGDIRKVARVAASMVPTRE